jgi:hypothetical protein
MVVSWIEAAALARQPQQLSVTVLSVLRDNS